MKKFKFFLVKTVSWTPRYKQAKKNLTIEAEDSVAAYKFIGETYPDWEVSMFWPVWP